MQKIALLILKNELKRKHKLKRELKKKIEEMCKKIREETSFLFINALRYRIRASVSHKTNKWKRTHQKKLENLRLNPSNFINQNPYSTRQPVASRPTVVHNFSSYELTGSEHEILSYSLDHYVSQKDKGKSTQTELEKRNISTTSPNRSG